MKQKIGMLAWWVSAAVLLFMMTPMNLTGIVTLGLLLVIAAMMTIQMPDIWSLACSGAKGYSSVFALGCGMAAGMCFFDMWKESTLLGEIAHRIGLHGEMLTLFLALAGGIAASFSVFVILGFMRDVRCSKATEAGGRDVDVKACLVLLGCAVCAITIGSKSSPLYPHNDWMDANCYLTVGKSMLHGKVLYRDIFEHKGLFMYILHAAAYLVSHTTFLGVYILEIAAAFAFLLLAYKTARLFCTQRVLFLMPVFAAMVYTTGSFAHGGSAEEYCLPFLAYALWLALRAMKEERSLTLGEYLGIGITSGCILWTKYTMLGFYVGWFIVPAYMTLRSGGIRALAKAVGMILLGVALASLPVFVYFGVNGAFVDLWEVYFYDNIFRYGAESKVAEDATLLQNLRAGLNTAFIFNTFMFQSMILGAGWLAVKRRGRMLVNVLASFVGLFVLTYSGGRPYMYYGMPFAVFAVLVLPGIDAVAGQMGRRLGKAVPCVFAVCALVILLMGNNSAYMLSMDREDMPQYQFSEIIKTVEEPTLLNYGFLDGGFYTVCDIVPNCKYFCCTNVPLPEMMQTQESFAQAGLTDFIVTRNTLNDFELYDCIAQSSYYHEGEMHTYFLYALKELGLGNS